MMKYLLDGQETERLRFRLFTKDDLQNLEDLYKDPMDRLFLALPAEPPAKEVCELWFGYCMMRYENNTGGLNALVEKESGKLIGQCGLLVQEIDGRTELEVAYAILPRYRGRGYASEAARTCRDFAFERGYAKTLISIIHVDNHQSRNIALKNGMIPIKQCNFHNIPVHIYSINIQDWEKKN